MLGIESSKVVNMYIANAVGSIVRFFKTCSKSSTWYLHEQSVSLIWCLFRIFLSEARIYARALRDTGSNIK